MKKMSKFVSDECDRVAQLTDEQFACYQKNVLAFEEPTTRWEKVFKKIAPGLWKYWVPRC